VGSEVAVVVMPAKWRVYRERLSRSKLSDDRLSLYKRCLQDLRAADVLTLDLDKKLRALRLTYHPRPLFHPADSHLSRLGFQVVATEALAPLVNVSLTDARRRMAALPSRETKDLGNLATILSLNEESWMALRYTLTERAVIAPPCTGTAGEDADIIVLGDSHSRYHDRLLPRLVEVATGMKVESRFAGGIDEHDFARLRAACEERPPKLILIVRDEKSFAAH